MKREHIDLLARFFIEQHFEFQSATWPSAGEPESDLYRIAAHYLSMTSWYGHEEELERIAETARRSPTCSLGLHREAESLGLDLAYFSASVRSGIARYPGAKAAIA